MGLESTSLLLPSPMVHVHRLPRLVTTPGDLEDLQRTETPQAWCSSPLNGVETIPHADVYIEVI